MRAHWAGGSRFPLAVMQRQTRPSTRRAPFPTTLLWHSSHRLSPGTGTRLRKHAGARRGRGSWVCPISQCYSAVGVMLRGRHVDLLHRSPKAAQCRADNPHGHWNHCYVSRWEGRAPSSLLPAWSVSRTSAAMPVPVITGATMGLAAILARCPAVRRGLQGAWGRCELPTSSAARRKTWGGCVCVPTNVAFAISPSQSHTAEFLLLSPQLPSLHSPSWCTCAWDGLNSMLGRRCQCPTPPARPSSVAILAEKPMAGKKWDHSWRWGWGTAEGPAGQNELPAQTQVN